MTNLVKGVSLRSTEALMEKLLQNAISGIQQIFKMMFSIDERIEKIEASQRSIEATLIKLLKKYDNIKELEKHLFDESDPQKRSTK